MIVVVCARCSVPNLVIVIQCFELEVRKFLCTNEAYRYFCHDLIFVCYTVLVRLFKFFSGFERYSEIIYLKIISMHNYLKKWI